MPSTALVTGASGFIAQQLIVDLLDQGHSVRGTVRSLAKGTELEAALSQHSARVSELALVEADLESDAGWVDAVRGVDVIFHLASPFPLATPKDPDELIRPAREGALRVLRAARETGVDRVILTSSGAAIAYGRSGGLPAQFTEEDWTDTNDTADCFPYYASKTLAERAAWDYVEAEGKGIGLTAINPVVVLGPILSAQVKTSVGIVARVLGGEFPALPRVGQQIVDVRDVSAAHIAAMNDPGTIGERYIVSDEFVMLSELAKVLRDAHPDRKKIPSREMPDFLVRGIALFNSEMKSIAKEIGKRRFCSSEKVRKLLGRDLIPAHDAIRASAESLIRYGAA